MWDKVDWIWVRDWVGRIFAALFLLGIFAYLTAMPVIRPGGVLQTLPDAMWFAAKIALPVSLAIGAVLAWRSARQGKR